MSSSKFAVNMSQQTRTSSKGPYYRDEMNLMWLLAGKVAVQTFGSAMSTLLERSLALNREIRYWDEILESYCYTRFTLCKHFLLDCGPRRVIFIQL